METSPPRTDILFVLIALAGLGIYWYYMKKLTDSVLGEPAATAPQSPAAEPTPNGNPSPPPLFPVTDKPAENG
jgi:hypothetical protein